MVISGMGGEQVGTISHLIKKSGEMPAPPPVKPKPVEKVVDKPVAKADKPVDRAVDRAERPVERSFDKVQVDRQIATTRAVAAAYQAAPQPTAVVDAFA